MAALRRGRVAEAVVALLRTSRQTIRHPIARAVGAFLAHFLAPERTR